MQSTGPLRIAVCGLGNVGRETARLLHKERRRYTLSCGRPIVLAAVCDRKAGREAKALGLPAKVRRITDYRKLIGDPEIDLIVELFGGTRHAKHLVLGALGAGQHVVTGNKALISSSFTQILRAARRGKRGIAFEAAVAGAVPIISGLRIGLAANRIESLYGIFNGTTNYILSQMAHSGCEMKEALKQAQKLGMAEKNPRLDLNGSDTQHKVSILASLMTGAWVPPGRVARTGIDRIEAEDVAFAVNKLNRTLRLLGTIGIRWQARPLEVEAHVQPTLVPLDHPLAAVHGGYNAALVSASAAEDLMFYGKGAGPGPAASAAIADILAIAKDPTAAAPPPAGNIIRLAPECPAPYYLKFLVKDVAGQLSRITGILGNEGISISEIYQDAARGQAASVKIVTHAAARTAIDRARTRVSHLATVSPRHSALRLLP
jgi:homoserine dehydrogenase